jgi:DNA-binding LytR/AlgR family response regulator
LHLSVIDIDWVETQGNYLALHAGPAVHLIRDTLAKFEGILDPERFARIHRTALVALDRVQEVAALSNGDASVRLRDGTQLRLSRNYRATASAVLGGTGNR